MGKVDTSGWRPFKLGGTDGLFDIVKGVRLRRADMVDGTIRYVGASAFHNGITNMIANDEHLHPGNTITVAYNGSVGETFYQDRAYWASDDINVLYPRFDLTPDIGLFLSALIRAVGQRYHFVDKWKLDEMIEATIPLPVRENGSPDWSYMEAFISKEKSRSSIRLEGLRRKAEEPEGCFDTSDWERFRIGGPDGLFHIEKGTRLTRADMREGTTPFIGASTTNNGITAYVGNTEHIHPGGVITVAYNGQKATGKAFYQPKSFWASDDVHVLYPNFELNEPIALFLLPIFRIAGEPYAFEDKWKIEYMEKDGLMLPAKPDGTPDWEFMEGYMSGLLDSQREHLRSLT